MNATAGAGVDPASPARLERRHDGAVLTLTVDNPPGNVLDTATCEAVTARLREAADDDRACLLVVRGAGAHFSFGASVREHLPEHADKMLAAMGRLLRALTAFPYPTLAAVQGRCLGGGLELALACGPILAAEGAVFAAAEIRLGVFAPAATALLQSRVPAGVAEEILLTGRDLTAAEMASRGLVARVVPDDRLDEAVDVWAREHFLPRSPVSLRVATRLLRAPRAAEFDRRLGELERAYLEQLLPLHDGVEGIRAFLEKRPPVWRKE